MTWVAKIRWANEYKQAKEAQLEAKEAQLETVKELTSARVLTEFRALKEMFDESSRAQSRKDVKQKVYFLASNDFSPAKNET